MSTPGGRIVVDPVTRIEGHLRIEAKLEGSGSGQKISDAWSATTMWRGLEEIIAGRDPRDAWLFAQRICGVCTTIHAMASVRAVEDALEITPPLNAHLIRNIIMASQMVHDHVVHFYHLHALDWVDVVSALDADPAKTAAIAQQLSDYPNSTAKQFAAVRDRLKAFVSGGRLGPFANGYWGHPAYKLPPEVNLMAVSHYLDALEFQREYIKVHAILGGKNPHPQTFVIGGMGTPIDPNQEAALNADKLAQLRRLLVKGLDFVRQAYLPDLLAIAAAYPEWTQLGAGPEHFMSFGDFTPQPTRAGKPMTDGLLPAGLIRGRDLSRLEPVDAGKIAEDVARGWYTYEGGDAKGLHPFDGQTTPHYTGPTPPYEYLDVEGKYTWLKAPRYDGLSVEVGPLARVLVAYAQGQQQVRSSVDEALRQLKAGPNALFSTLGRTLARGLESLLLAQHSIDLLDRLTRNIAGGDYQVADTRLWSPSSWPKRAQGAGFVEAPRGTLSHWVTIADGQVEHYQAVVPSTWNGSPRDGEGQPGAYELALVGTPVADAGKPLEILRTIHSYDPCMACAAHVLDADGNPVVEVKVS